jgi:hypothetical protein
VPSESLQDLSKRDVMAFLLALAALHGSASAGGAIHSQALADSAYDLADRLIEKQQTRQA